MKEQSVGKMEDTKKAFLLLLVLLTEIKEYAYMSQIHQDRLGNR